MKATLEFALPEENGEFRNAIDGTAWKVVAWELDRTLRESERHGSSSESQHAEWARKVLREVMEEQSVTFD